MIWGQSVLGVNDLGFRGVNMNDLGFRGVNIPVGGLSRGQMVRVIESTVGSDRKHLRSEGERLKSDGK